VFCVVLLGLTWRLERARGLHSFLAVYLVAVLATYAIPSGLGHDVARLRLLALPITLLIAALRRWRPLPLVVVSIALATAWNVFPLATSWASSAADRSENPKVWPAPVDYLRTHLGTGYRVEAVDTVDHWPALYLARAGVPLVRGWFRQDDHPVASLLYRRRYTAAEYDAWLRRLGVAYVVLTNAPTDHSSRREAELVRSGAPGLRPVFQRRGVSIYAVPHPRSIVTGPGRPIVLSLRQSHLVVRVSRGGTYRVAVRWSPYWHASTGCLARDGGMLRLRTRNAATVRLAFDVDAGSLLDAFAGASPRCRSAAG
jgi:hypothetical protein